MTEPAPGDLFAVLWEARRAGEVDSYRVIEVVAVDADHAHSWFYRDVFDSPPAEVVVTELSRARIHERSGHGPIPMPLAEIASDGCVPVRRAPDGTV